MKEVKFKVGDLVYIPHYSNKILKLSDKPTVISMLYSFEGCKLFADIFPVDESGTVAEGGQVICHATQENYERLSATFTNIEFEPPPPKRKEPKEIIKAMLKAGHKYILCEVYCSGDYRDYHGTDSIIGIDEHDGSFIGGTEQHYWETATPINSKGQKIIDFIDGKCVLENGEVME